jgi:RHS repeat-associated protein
MGNYEEEIDNNGNFRKLYYIPGGEALAGVYVVDNTNADMYYTYTDYLGSVLAITNDAGTLQQEQRFDAWGRRRNLEDWEYDEISTIDIVDRGYTFHQHLNEFGIINMNGRLYDPVVGRMLSPDPQLQNPGYTQNYNRYSYVYNNPLKYTDPDGEWIANALMAIGSAYMKGVIQNGGEFNPGKWTTIDVVSMTSAGINGWNSMGSVGLKKDMREYSDFLDNIYKENQFNYEQEILNSLESSLYDGPGDDFYQNKKTGEIKWFDGSAPKPGWEHLGSGLKEGVNITPYTALSWLKDPDSFHNSKLGRFLYPDAWAISFNVNVTTGNGGEGEAGVIILNRGPKIGMARTYGQAAFGAGIDINAGIKVEGINYIGPISEIDFPRFEGLSISGGLSGNISGFDFGACASWGPNINGGGFTLSRGFTLGGGFPAFLVGGSLNIGGIITFE